MATELTKRDKDGLEALFNAAASEVRLDVIARLPADRRDAALGFLAGLADRQTSYSQALDRLHAATRADGYISTANVPIGALLRISLATTGNVLKYASPEAARKEPPDRTLMVRRVGEAGVAGFKLLGSDLATGRRSAHTEQLQVNEVVDLGTVTASGRKRTLMPEIRLAESLGVLRPGGSPIELGVEIKRDDQYYWRTGIPLAVTQVAVDGAPLLPS